MTDKTQGMRDLLAKVEGGRVGQFQNLDSQFGHGNGITAKRAYNGSLDAAKALHDSVLPGYDLQICTYEYDLFEVSVSKPTSVTTYDGLSEIISRAWLIAILKALIAQATP